VRPRLLLALSLLPALAFARSPPAGAAETSALQTLGTQCLVHAADPKNPWAMAHGITALGSTFAAADGRAAADAIVQDFVQRGGDAKSPQWGFARMTREGIPVEPHPNLLTKTLVLSGLKDARKFQTPHGEVSLGELVRSVQHGFRHVPDAEPYWIEVGWTLDLLAGRLTPKNAKFKNGAGEEVNFNRVMDDALAYLEVANAELAAGMDKGLAEVPKNKQGIYAHSCGGLHLLQAVMHWSRFPQVRKKWGKRLDRQVAVLFYRLGSEQRQYEAVKAAHPEYKLQLGVQMMKFYGHFLETTGRMRKDNVLTFSKAQLQQVRKAEALLDAATRDLEAMGAFSRMDELQKTQRQIHLDLIGDACHAANGLALWKAK
jgi:hypothetical protein